MAVTVAVEPCEWAYNDEGTFRKKESELRGFSCMNFVWILDWIYVNCEGYSLTDKHNPHRLSWEIYIFLRS